MPDEEEENLEDIIPMIFPDELLTIPSCIIEDLENICRDLDSEEKITTIFEDNPTTQTSAVTHTFKSSSNFLERSGAASISTSCAFKGSTDSFDNLKTVPNFSDIFSKPSNLHHNKDKME